jgi:hypothetical protein
MAVVEMSVVAQRYCAVARRACPSTTPIAARTRVLGCSQDPWLDSAAPCRSRAAGSDAVAKTSGPVNGARPCPPGPSAGPPAGRNQPISTPVPSHRHTRSTVHDAGEPVAHARSPGLNPYLLPAYRFGRAEPSEAITD